jgi:DNA primase
VKDAARVEEVVGEFVASSARVPRYLGLCPFHNEKTPSSTSAPTWASSSASAAARAAIASLPAETRAPLLRGGHPLAGQALQHRPAGGGADARAAGGAKRAREPRRGAAVGPGNWSVEQLWNTDEGKRIGLSYFHERGFRDATIRTFQLGYVPEFGNAFTAAATAHGFNPETCWRRPVGSSAATMAAAVPGTSSQGRVTFPILASAASPSPSVRAR